MSIFPNLPEWRRVQQAYAVQPLEYLPDFPRVAARHEAWWHYELAGPPLVLASAGRDPAVRGGRLLDLLTQPEEWLAARLAQVRNTHLVGDALPSARVDYGPVCLGMLLGAPIEFTGGTTWTHAFINDDWSNAPQWQIHADNPWWQLLPRLLQLNAQTAIGRYIPMNPSLGGTGDVLLNTRGSDKLSMDLVDQPEKISASVEAIFQAWQIGFEKIWQTTTAVGAGAINWVGLWSDQPYHVLECDFNYMIGPRPFQSLFLPEIARQAAAAERSIFHLDGPGAARHCNALLDTPEITAIQYVTGAGNSALTKLEMLKRIQGRRRPLQVTVHDLGEALELARQLDPRGLCLLIEVDATPDVLDAFYAELCAMF